jgi:hypothetical protein
MRLPEFITFTGADDGTDADGMVALAAHYRIEWGILHSLSRYGVPRYPRRPERFHGRGLVLAAHLCGGFSDDIMAGEVYDRVPGNIFAGYGRIQVNHRDPDENRIAGFAEHVGIRCIAQTRTGFPQGSRIQWLYDASGGRGVLPSAWPRHPGGDVLVGYAGGIGPENVREVIAAIASTGPYWLDMESGVRTDDRFDLGKVGAVCAAVYGEA